MKENDEDHPRSCGEYFASLYAPQAPLGSSPLMRGIQNQVDEEMKSLRIIPAHAGNTGTAFRPRFSWKDHPRSCGEYVFLLTLHNHLPGSSPLMRGILLFINNKCIQFQDHPRSCGEYLTDGFTATMSIGSSPLMRGILATTFRFTVYLGIIPAHAGNTLKSQLTHYLT